MTFESGKWLSFTNTDTLGFEGQSGQFKPYSPFNRKPVELIEKFGWRQWRWARLPVLLPVQMFLVTSTCVVCRLSHNTSVRSDSCSLQHMILHVHGDWLPSESMLYTSTFSGSHMWNKTEIIPQTELFQHFRVTSGFWTRWKIKWLAHVIWNIVVGVCVK